MPSASATKRISIKPRVHIFQEVTIGDATEKKEIPFVMAVMADLSGDNASELPDLGKRAFSGVDAFTFDTFLEAQKPRASFEVDNTLTGEGKLKVNMTFESMADFSPAAVAQKVDGLKDVYELRQKLSALLTSAESKPKIEKAWQEVLNALVKRPELAKQLQTALERGSDSPAA